MKLIVGLGNPGKEYERTRHNVGFMAVDKLAGILNLEYRKQKKYNAECAEIGSGSDKAVIAKPMTFMNNSGQSVSLIARYYKIKPDDIMVISDDINLELGKVRMRKGGEDGGHKGLRSIIEYIGKDFWRIRIGIGCNKGMSAEAYVLQEFSDGEIKEIKKVIDEVAETIRSEIL